MMQNVLFVGGFADAKRMGIDDRMMVVDIPVPNEAPLMIDEGYPLERLEVHSYTRRRFQASGKLFCIFGLNSLTDAEIMDLLIENYRF